MSPKDVEMYLIFQRLEDTQREKPGGPTSGDKAVEYALYYRPLLPFWRTVDDTTFRKVETTIPNGLILYTQIGKTAVNYNVQRYLRMFGLAIHKFDPGWDEESKPPPVFAIRVWAEFEAQFDKSNDAFLRDRLILAKTVQLGFLTNLTTNRPETKELKWVDKTAHWDSGVQIEFQDWAMIPFNHKFDVVALYSMWIAGDPWVDKTSAKVPSFVSHGGWLPNSYAAEKVTILYFPPTAPSRKRRRLDPSPGSGHNFTNNSNPLALGDNGTPGAGPVAAVADADAVLGYFLGGGGGPLDLASLL
jgi:hypothetical protein